MSNQSNSPPLVGVANVSPRNVTLATDPLAVLTDLATRVVDALDAGPGAIDPQIAATIAVATPLLALLCCLCLCLVCRFTRLHWRMAAACGGGALLLPKSGTDPDRALESYEDELDEVDSVDEPVRRTPPPLTDGEDEEAGDAPGSPASAMRACCSSIADAIAACPDEATTAAAPASAPSAPAPAKPKPKPRAKGNGHVRAASVSAR